MEQYISPDDVNRLFGRFRWGAYSPAGALERSGFFWRHVNRVRRDPNQSKRTRRSAAAARWYVITLLFVLPAVALFLALVKRV